jgi:[ribosomal protein S5]-alanine N-acetyltransferase
MNKDIEVMKYFPKVLTDSETAAMVQRINLKLTKEFIGFTGFSILTFETFFTPCIEISWRYKKEVWGRGFATEAAIACFTIWV